MEMRIELTTATEQQLEIILTNQQVLLAALLFLTLCCTAWGIVRHRRQHWLKKATLLVLNTLAFTSVLTLIMPINLDKAEQISVNHLYTQGVSPAQLDRSLQAAPNDSHWLTQGLVEQWQQQQIPVKPVSSDGRLQQALVRDLSHWYWLNENSGPLVVHGHGFNQQQYQQANIDQIEHRPGAWQSVGFKKLQWPKQVYQGQSWTLSGQIQGHKQVSYDLQVTDPGGIIIAQLTGLSDQQSFSLQLPADVAGTTLYQLSLISGAVNGVKSAGADTRHQHVKPQTVGTEPFENVSRVEQLAVSVIEAPAMTVMIMQSAPSFETRHLKNLLQQQGHGVMVRTRISQDKYLLQYSNLGKSAIADSTLSADSKLLETEFLATIDVLLLDGRTLVELSNAERQSLFEAVNSGLGVIVMMDNSVTNGVLSQISGLAIANVEVTNKPVSANASELFFSLANGRQLAFLSHQANRLQFIAGETLIKNPAGQQVAMYAQQGEGRLTITSLNHSYQWQLSSNRDDYQRYWQYLLQTTARVRIESQFFPQSDDDFLSIHDGEPLCVFIKDSQSEGRDLASSPENYSLRATWITGDHLDIPLLKKQPHLPQYCGVIFPRQTGWMKVSLLHADEHIAGQWRYVYSSTDFIAYRNHKKQLASANINVDSEKGNAISMAKGSGDVNYQPLNKIWIWLSLILLIGYLWYERKKYLHP
ncbi:hypothetical protein [Thalassotalea mangrovi]|uniref:Uncharacterized protein n=1 Tax=Thalassotalea mangrovi TaxID=2572245 RepID=A0A4U1B3D5_9GAMM|nr:hypothetical protein [Thalassotalea mangrovi]TKB44343.1 hypothetical protein E8M12_11875 [Thalassotalea mangrovi]